MMTSTVSTGGPVVRRTEDRDAMRALALASGLEDGTFEDVIVSFGYYIGDELFGCASLKRNGERYAVEWLAVSDQFRGRGIGRMLVGKVESEARARGAERLWALARAPRFFESVGFRVAGPGESGGPVMSNCLLCSQYQRSCFPAVVVKDLTR